MPKSQVNVFHAIASTWYNEPSANLGNVVINPSPDLKVASIALDCWLCRALAMVWNIVYDILPDLN